MGRQAVAAGAVAGLALIGLSGPAAWASAASPNGSGSASSGGGAAPAGNNGHIQIDEYAMDGGNGHDPHVGCGFSISFFGYDRGTQTATVSITPWAPTRGGTAFHDAKLKWITGHRTGGNQLDWNYPVTPETVAGIFSGVAPAHEGYLARIEVEVSGSQGSDDKYKMVWIAPCTSAPGATPNGANGANGAGHASASNGTSPASAVAGASEAGNGKAATGKSAVLASSTSAGSSSGASPAPSTAVLGESISRPLASAPVATASPSLIAGLPFTGADIAGEGAVALGLIGVGGFLTRRYRLRRQ
jgi:hypothetical protein